MWIWEARWFTPLYWSGSFVKIIRWENDNFDLTLQKRRFCKAKEPLLPCKSGSFTMRNNRFYNTLIIKWLHNSCACERYLQFYYLFPIYKTQNTDEAEGYLKRFAYSDKVKPSACPLPTYQLPEIRLALFCFCQKSEKTTIGRIKKVVFYWVIAIFFLSLC